MAGLKVKQVFVLIIFVAAFVLSSCNPILDLRALVEERVSLSKVALVLYDGSTIVSPGETIIWPDTIFGDPATKVLTLKNTGNSNVTLTGPNIVSITGGSGAASYGGIVQPVQMTLPPGSSTTFSATFTPVAPDDSYSCDFVINSNDSLNPSYVFHGLGWGKQWHGSKAVVTSTTQSFSYPKLAYLGGATPVLYLAYLIYDSGVPANRGIALRYSTDGGKNWSAPSLVVPTSTFNISGFSFAAANSRLHLFYCDSTNNTMNYTTSNATPGSINFSSNYVGVSNGSFAYGTNYYGVNNSVIVVANGNVYLAAYDNTSATKRLYLYVRGDSLPTMGIPNFTQYTITDGTTHTGGFYPSIKVDSSNIYVSYLDSKVLRAVVSSISSPGTFTYRTIFTDPTYNIGANALAIDSNQAYVLWFKSDGGCMPYCTPSTNLTLSSWSSPSSFTGESASGTPITVLNKPGSTMYAAWTSYLGTYTLKMATSTDNGSTWSTQFIDNTANGLGGQSISIDSAGSDLYVAYSTSSGHPNNYSITLKKSRDGGVTW